MTAHPAVRWSVALGVGGAIVAGGAGRLAAQDSVGVRDSIPSPRLRALAAAVAAGRLEAVDRFRDSTAREGTPLIEPWPADSTKRLVTFLWRGDLGAKEILVAGSALGRDRAQNRLARLAGTDLWWVSRVLPNDLRTVYRFVVDPPAGTTGTREHARVDPGNPRALPVPRDPDVAGSTDSRISLLEMPGAEPQPWLGDVAAERRGSVSMERFTSPILGNTRRIFLYRPAGYSGARRYPLVVVFDAMAYLGMVPTPTILDNLIAAGRIPPVVAVLIDNPDQATRNRELDCYPPFVRFLVEELSPWIRARLSIATDGRRNVLAGSSGGGQAAMCAGQHHPELFGNVLAQSGSFFTTPDDPIGDEWVYRHLITGPRLPLRFYLDVGRYEPTFSVTGVRTMRNVIEARGYPLRYREFAGGHDYSWWRSTLADGLIFLIGKPR